MKRSVILLTATALGACASVPKAAVPVTGEWGGRHVALSLSEASGTLNYDCAAGTIDGPLLPRSDGTFEVEGRHTPGTGGPEIVGQVRPSFRALYWGVIRGQRMTIQARVENGVALGPFTLVKDAEPIIFRCL